MDGLDWDWISPGDDDDAKGNLIGKDDSTDHDWLVWILVIAVLFGENLDHHRSDCG